MSEWGITVKCNSENQASRLASSIETQFGLESRVMGDCRHPPDKVKQYREDSEGYSIWFCNKCNQKVIRVESWETREDGRGEGNDDGCLHSPRDIKERQEYTSRDDGSIYGSLYGCHCKRCDCEVIEVKYYLLPDLADAQLKLPDLLNADGDAPGIDHLLIMPERLDDTAGRGEPVGVQS